MQTRVLTEQNKSCWLYSFNSLVEIERFIAETPRTWSDDSSATATRKDSWDLGLGYKGALDLARKGWIEGAQRAQRALKEFPPQSPEPETKFALYGHKPSVARYMTGRPDCMVRRVTPPTMECGRVLTLIVPIALSCAVRAEYAANFGLGVAQYINQLETNGTRVELLAGFKQTSFDSKQQTCFTWTVKRADQPLDLAVLAFAIGHPAMFRRIGFAMLERGQCPELMGYGLPTDFVLADVINAPVGSVVLNGINNANTVARTIPDALEYITSRIDAAMGDNEADSGQKEGWWNRA